MGNMTKKQAPIYFVVGKDNVDVYARNVVNEDILKGVILCKM